MTPTPEQVAQWMRDVSDTDKVDPFHNDFWTITSEELHRLVLRAMAAQAEADAVLCDSLEYEFKSGAECATAIRANAPKPTK